MNSKKCPKCNNTKTFSEFYFSANIYSSYCKTCVRERDNAKRNYEIPIDLLGEIWLPIKGVEGYLISNLGRCKSLKRRKGNILNQNNITGGYIGFNLNNKTVKCHRLVAIAFIPNPENKSEVNHINGIKNDNRVENLEWCTTKENSKHAWNTGLCNSSKGENHGRSKLTEKQILEIKNKYIFRKNTHKMLAKEYGVCKSTILLILNNKIWKHI